MRGEDEEEKRPGLGGDPARSRQWPGPLQKPRLPDGGLGGQVAASPDSPFSLYSPVALPGMADVRVMDAMLVRLLIEEVEHVLDGQGQSRATVGCAEDGLEQVIHKLLQCALGMGDTFRSSPASCLGDRAGEVMTSGDTVSPTAGLWQLYLSSVHGQQAEDR